MKLHLYTILQRLLIKNNIKINTEELKLQLSSHPSYPSLHAVTGVLDHFSIPNLALRLSVNKEILEQLPSSFIANVSTENGDILVLVEKKKNRLKITSNNKKSDLINHDDFLKKWNGIIVAIEKDDTVEDYKKNPFSDIALWSLYALTLVCLILFYYSNSSAFSQWHFALSLLGLATSIIIVKHELGLQSETANNFCNLSSKTSCDAVLESNGAQLFGIFKLSDVSIITFLAYGLCWISFSVLGINNFNVVSIISLLAFPFILYSIYYQYKIVKKWCPLCLSIAAILIFQIGASLFFGNTLSDLSINTTSVLVLFLSVVFVSGLWGLVKPLLIKKKELTILKVEHFKFKRDFSIFQALINQSEKLKIQNYFPNEIILGNREASTELILVTSPLCHYCKKAHSDIEELLSKLDRKIKVIIRFNVDTSNKEGDLYKITSRLLDIYNSLGEQFALKALSEVYSDDVDLGKWIKSQPKDFKASYSYTLDEQRNWNLLNGINFTPALYINKRLFPKEYDRTDLIYFIDDLIEASKAHNIVLTEQAIAS